MTGPIDISAQEMLEDHLQLRYEYVFDGTKAWSILWTVAFLNVPFHIVTSTALSLVERLICVACFFLFVRQVKGDPVRKQLTADSQERLLAYLRNELTSGRD